MRRNFSTYIKREMKKRGWKQKDLAAKSGLSEPTISNYIKGRNEPKNYAAIVGLCKAFNITPNDLLGKKPT